MRSVGEREEGQRVEQQAEREDHRGAPEHAQAQPARAPLERRAQGQRDGDAHHEEEEREDHVGRRPPVPCRVLERRVHRAPRARIVDQHHRGHREPAERVHGEQARRRAG